jgi:hypothetical protein
MHKQTGLAYTQAQHAVLNEINSRIVVVRKYIF